MKLLNKIFILLVTSITLLNIFPLAFSTDDKCSSFSSCGLCVGYHGCGWCESERKCIDLLMHGGAPEYNQDYSSVCSGKMITKNDMYYPDLFSGQNICSKLVGIKQITHLQSPLTAIKFFFTSETCNLFNSIKNCGSAKLSTYIDNSFKGLRLDTSLAVNFYDNIKIIDKSYTLNQNDRVCIGDTLKLDSLQSYGEWFSKGGPGDSPPITWVTKEEFIDMVIRVTKYFNDHYSEITQVEIKPPDPYGKIVRDDNIPLDLYGNVMQYKTRPFDPYGNGSYISAPWGEFRGEVYLPNIIESNETVLGKKIPLYKSTSLGGYGRVYYNWIYGTLICTANSNITSSQTFSGNTLRVISDKLLEFNVTSRPSCIFYLERIVPAGGTKYKDENNNYIFEESQFYLLLVPKPLWAISYIDLTNPTDTTFDWVDALTLAEITRTYTFQVDKTTLEPDLKIKDYSIEGDNIKLIVKNNGDVAAKIDSIQSDVPIELLGNNKIEPDKTGEVYGKLKFLNTKQSISMSDKIEFNLVYRTDELGCLKTKEYGIRTSAIACKSNIDCGSTLNPGTCCDGLCRDSKEGVCRDENGDGIMEWIKYI